MRACTKKERLQLEKLWIKDTNNLKPKNLKLTKEDIKLLKSRSDPKDFKLFQANTSIHDMAHKVFIANLKILT